MLIIAHRGASAKAPENTLAAFREAIRAGADLIEMDLRLSRDEEVMVFHDHSLRRTTDGAGWVEDLSRAELRKLDAGSWFSSRYRGEPIPTLEEVIKLLQPHQTGLYLEIKLDPGREEVRSRLVEKTHRILRLYSFRSRAFLASFDREAINISKKIDPELPTGLIFREPSTWENLIDDKFGGVDIACARWNIITTSLIRKAREADTRVFGWTIKGKTELRAVASLGVDGLAANDPAWLRGELGILRDET